MPTLNRKIDSFLDIGLVASMGAFIAVLINGDSISDPLASVLLIVLALIVTAVGIWREASKEQQLDEVQLAGASFGSRWGISAVIFATLLATFLIPLQNLIELAGSSFEASDGSPISVPVKLFVLGMVCAMVIELSIKSIAAAFWRRAKR